MQGVLYQVYSTNLMGRVGIALSPCTKTLSPRYLNTSFFTDYGYWDFVYIDNGPSSHIWEFPSPIAVKMEQSTFVGVYFKSRFGWGGETNSFNLFCILTRFVANKVVSSAYTKLYDNNPAGEACGWNKAVSRVKLNNTGDNRSPYPLSPVQMFSFTGIWFLSSLYKHGLFNFLEIFIFIFCDSSLDKIVSHSFMSHDNWRKFKYFLFRWCGMTALNIPYHLFI